MKLSPHSRTHAIIPFSILETYKSIEEEEKLTSASSPDYVQDLIKILHHPGGMVSAIRMFGNPQREPLLTISEADLLTIMEKFIALKFPLTYSEDWKPWVDYCFHQKFSPSFYQKLTLALVQEECWWALNGIRPLLIPYLIPLFQHPYDNRLDALFIQNKYALTWLLELFEFAATLSCKERHVPCCILLERLCRNFPKSLSHISHQARFLFLTTAFQAHDLRSHMRDIWSLLVSSDHYTLIDQMAPTYFKHLMHFVYDDPSFVEWASTNMQMLDEAWTSIEKELPFNGHVSPPESKVAEVQTLTVAFHAKAIETAIRESFAHSMKVSPELISKLRKPFKRMTSLNPLSISRFSLTIDLNHHPDLVYHLIEAMLKWSPENPMVVPFKNGLARSILHVLLTKANFVNIERVIFLLINSMIHIPLPLYGINLLELQGANAIAFQLMKRGELTEHGRRLLQHQIDLFTLGKMSPVQKEHLPIAEMALRLCLSMLLESNSLHQLIRAKSMLAQNPKMMPEEIENLLNKMCKGKFDEQMLKDFSDPYLCKIYLGRLPGLLAQAITLGSDKRASVTFKHNIVEHAFLAYARIVKLRTTAIPTYTIAKLKADVPILIKLHRLASTIDRASEMESLCELWYDRTREFITARAKMTSPIDAPLFDLGYSIHLMMQEFSPLILRNEQLCLSMWIVTRLLIAKKAPYLEQTEPHKILELYLDHARRMAPFGYTIRSKINAWLPQMQAELQAMKKLFKKEELQKAVDQFLASFFAFPLNRQDMPLWSRAHKTLYQTLN